jgi:hypothetical protein
MLQAAWKALPKKLQDCIDAKDCSSMILDGHRPFLISEAIVLTAVLGPTEAAQAAQAARPFLPSSARSLIQKVAAEAKAAKFADCTASSVAKFLNHPLFSGGSTPKFEKVKGKKRAASVATATADPACAASSSAASAVDLGDEEGGAPAAKKPYSIWHEAAYAMNAPAGDRRVLAHNIAMHNEELAQRAAAEQERLELARTLRESAMEQDRSECAEDLVLAQATRESAVEQDRFERAEALVLAQATRESAAEQDRFERAEALVLAQATRESEAEYARFEQGTFREFDADPSGEMDRDEFKAFFSSFVGGGGGENMLGSDDLEDVFGYSEVCVCCSLRGRVP